MTARIAVIGAGWWSQGWHLPQISRHRAAAVAAVVDPSRQLRSTLNPDMRQLGEFGEMYACPVFLTLDEMLRAEVDVDGVVICTSHAAHFENAKMALERDIHVLCEKPMCTDPVEAWQLAEIAERRNASLMINNTANWRENTVRAHQMVVKEGLVGNIEHATCYMGSPLLWLFDDPANTGWTKPQGSMLGNGFAWGQLSHSLASILRTTELTPIEVLASMRFSEKSGADLYDTAIIRCEENGATIAFQGTASLPGENPTSQKQISNKIFGSEGFVDYSGLDLDPSSGDLVLRRHDGTQVCHEGFYFENYEQDGEGPESLLSFIDLCCASASKKSPEPATVGWNGCDGLIGARVVSVIDAMYRSALDGGMFESVVAPGNITGL